MPSPWFGDTENLGPYAWDSVWLGGELLPGVWRVKLKKSRSVEKVKVKGSDGITLRDNGRDGGSLTLTGRLWHQIDWEILQEIWAKLDPEKPGSLRQPLDIYSALPDLVGIRNVYVEALELESPETANGTLNVTLTCSEWFPQTKPTSTSKQVKGFDGADRTEWTENQLAAPGDTTGDLL